MASFKDYLDGSIEVNESNISKAVSTIASALNKRLRRIENAGYNYQGLDSEPYSGPDSIAGVRKFKAKGMDTDELYAEYKREKAFYESELSSLSGMRKFASEMEVAVENISDYLKLKDKREKRQSGEYVLYDWGDSYTEGDEDEGLEDSERSEYQEDYDFYGVFRAEHLYNYMRKNFGVELTSKYDSETAVKFAQNITARYWGNETEDYMAKILYNTIMENGLNTKTRHKRPFQ